jgi:hypothetical protein
MGKAARAHLKQYNPPRFNLPSTPHCLDAMKYRRYYRLGGTYFFTVVTDRRQPLLIEYID